MSDQAPEPYTQRKVLEAMRAVLSDDHSYERRLASLRDVVDQLVREAGAAGLGEFTVALSLFRPRRPGSKSVTSPVDASRLAHQASRYRGYRGPTELEAGLPAGNVRPF